MVLNSQKTNLKKWSHNLKTLKEAAGVVNTLYFMQHSLSTQLNMSVVTLALVLPSALERVEKQYEQHKRATGIGLLVPTYALHWSLGCF